MSVKLAGPGSAARRRSGWWVVVVAWWGLFATWATNEQRAGAETGIRRQLRASVAADRRRHCRKRDNNLSFKLS